MIDVNLILLPLIGAFIGYATNFVAIKMLFFPRKPYFIFGLRIPFTPGLIPKKRKDLIDKISTVVALKIIDKKEIVKYIYKKKNRQFLYEFSEKLINSLLSKKMSSISINYKKLKIIIEDFLNNNLDDFIRQKLSNIQIDTDYLIYNAFLMLDKTKTVKNYIENDKIENIKSFIDSITAKSLLNLSNEMDSDEMRELVKRKIKNALDKYTDDSNILITSFVSMIGPLIEDNERIVDIIINEIKSILLDDKMQCNISKSVYNSLENEFLNRNIEYALKKIGNLSLDEVRKYVSNKVDDFFNNFDIKNKIIDGVLNNIDKKKLSFEITALIRLTLNRYTFYDVLHNFKPDLIEKLPSMSVNNLLFVIKKESDKIFNFDIAQIARKKLERFDISEVEDVVLNISKDQFKYINVFGGLLGFLIGITEFLIR